MEPTNNSLADRIAHAIDAIRHTAVRNPRDGGASMRRAKDVLIGIVSEVVAASESAAAEIERLRAELAAKQLETRTPLPEATWVKIPLQHEIGLTTWHGKRLRDLSAADFDACKADAARGLGSVDALLGVAEEARVRRALAEAAPTEGPSDEVVDGRKLKASECTDERIAKQLRWARECERPQAMLTLIEMVIQRAGVRL